MAGEKVLQGSLVELLERVELLEEPLLAWGETNVGLDEEAVERLATEVLGEHGLGGTTDALLDAAEKAGLLYFDPILDKYRSRSAETLRLMANLRQLIHGDGDVPPSWQSRPTLVRDFRFERRPRRRPRRDRPAADVVAAARAALQPVGRDALQAMLEGNDGEQLALSGFQLRSVEAVLAAVSSPRAAGVMVSAGTGAGKTKAFYLPAFAYLAGLVGHDRWTKLIAVYPRKELLKDQFSEAVRQARLVAPALDAAGCRRLVLGAYYGDVPHTEGSILRPSWRPSRGGHTCPYLRCPECDGELVRRPHDKQRLECACGVRIGADEVQLNRRDMAAQPPDIVFTTAEMLNRSLANLSHGKIVGVGADRPPPLLLLDEVHTYTGTSGAQTALLLRRWAHRTKARSTTYVGLSATLREPRGFFAQVAGLPADQVASVEARQDELETAGAEYLVALRNDAGAGTATLSTSIQTAMLLARCLDRPDRPVSSGLFGSKTFAFTDNLDVTNRLFSNLCDAEGRTIKNRPIPNKASLATLRHPYTDQEPVERHLAGQSWDLPLQLGNDLTDGDYAHIGRVHSKDAGVDPNARVVVATSSLEIGYDDPQVGAVLQHGAPRDPAQFLQRKGRAGRSISMRPWTVIVLSEYGRDRLSYESWDLLFNPELPPKQLPTGNRYLLRMHAAAALLDWLAEELDGHLRIGWSDMWRLLAGPPEQGRYFDSNREDQLRIARLLERLLEEPEVQDRYATYVASALRLDNGAVAELLWYPPRSILLSAVPALLRRVQTCWQDEQPSRTEDGSPPTPLPEHMSANLFSALELPEVEIHAERRGGESTYEESLPFDRAMREFCPGNVSRRAATDDQFAAHWVPIPDLDLDEIQTIDPADHYGSLEAHGTIAVPCSNLTCEPTACTVGSHDLPVLRPTSIAVARTPKGLSPSSRAFPIWRSSFEPEGTAVEVEIPEDSHAGLTSMAFHLHTERAYVRTVRAVIGTDGSALVDRTERRYRTRLRHGGDACAIGVTSEVDAVRLELRLPPEIASLAQLPDPLERSVRAAWLRHRFIEDLDPYVNQFKARWLHDAAIAALAAELHQGDHTSVDAALDAIEPELPRRMQESISTLLERVDAESVLGTPMRVRDGIIKLLASDQVVGQTRATLQLLREPLGTDAGAWLAERLDATMGLAVLRGAQIVCADQDADAIILDRDHQGRQWLTEVTPGGAGFLEELLRRVSADPRRFTRAIRQALEPSDSAAVDAALRSVLDAAGAANPLHGSLETYRAARGPQARSEALEVVRTQLDQIGHAPTHPTVAALLSRVLRPGSSAATDRLIAELVRLRDSLEERLRLEVDNRIFASLASADESYGALTRLDGQAARLDAIQSILWRRGWEAEADGLSAWNPYEDPPPSAAPILRHRIATSADVIDIAASRARERCLATLAESGSATLRCHHADPGMLAVLIAQLTASTVDLDVLRCRPRLSTIARANEALLAVVELPEVL